MRAARLSMPAASTASVAAEIALATQALGRLRQLVSDDKPSHEDEAGVADLSPGLGEFADLAVEILAELADAIFLAGIAGDLVAASIDRQGDLRHQCLSTALSRSIVASS